MRAPILLLLAVLTGCALPLSSLDDEFQANSCGSDGECGDGATCANVSGHKACVATQVDLSGLKLVMTPSGGSSTVTTGPTVFDPSGTMVLSRTASHGFDETFDARLPPLNRFKFKTVYPCNEEQGDDTPTPLQSQLAFTSVSDAGFPVATFFSQPDKDDPNLAVAELPPGLFTVSVQPLGGCASLPPSASLGICLQADCPDAFLRPSKVTTLNLAEDSVLQGSISSTVSLKGWTVDLLDSVGFNLVSARLSLMASTGPHTLVGFENLRFNWPDKDMPPIFRLSPPTGVIAPTIYWDLASILGVSGELNVNIDLGDFLAQHVQTEVVVEDMATEAPQVGAQVTFQSLSIDGLDTFTSFTTTAQTDGHGLVSVDLPPGNYLVRATSFDDGLSIGDSMLAVAYTEDQKHDPLCSCGHVLLLPHKTTLSGSAATPQGDLLDSVLVGAAGSPVVQSSGISGLTAVASTPLPRAVSALTNHQGDFKLGVDVGGPIDFWVRPESASGFPWLVRPQLLFQVPGKMGKVDTSLEGLILPAPAIVRGRLTDSDGSPVANADVAAYLDVMTSTGKGKIVLQVGDTTTDADGNYVLALPPSPPQ